MKGHAICISLLGKGLPLFLPDIPELSSLSRIGQVQLAIIAQLSVPLSGLLSAPFVQLLMLLGFTHSFDDPKGCII